MDHRGERHKALYAAKTVPFTVPKGLLTGLGEALRLFCNESIQATLIMPYGRIDCSIKSHRQR